MPRTALNSQTQLCRICDQFKAAREFISGSSYCRPCDAERHRRYLRGEGEGVIQAMRQDALAKRDEAQRFSELQRRDAIAKHALPLDLAIYALWQDGGFGAVVLGVQDAVKRLGRKKRIEIAAEGWIV